MAGRPTKPPAEKRTEQVPPLRVTLAEKLLIEERAALAGLTVTDYCRHVVFDRPLRVDAPQSSEHGAVLAELTRIGVNLNQIARHANSTGVVAGNLAAMQAQLAALAARLDPEAHR